MARCALLTPVTLILVTQMFHAPQWRGGQSVASVLKAWLVMVRPATHHPVNHHLATMGWSVLTFIMETLNVETALVP